jgi:hypothetical protein
MSFVVPRRGLKSAIANIHDVELGSPRLTTHPLAATASPSTAWKYESEQATAD